MQDILVFILILILHSAKARQPANIAFFPDRLAIMFCLLGFQ